MNYKKIHDKFVEYIKTTRPRQRLISRNPLDERLQNRFIYIEIHHIIPRSLGGLDDEKNLIELLPEEHIFIHMLRYKIFNKREDMLAIRFMLNGFDSSNRTKGAFKLVLNKKIRMGYAWIRTHAQLFRETKGWQTKEGIKRISEARKGTMPVRDLESGKIVGSVSTDHPNVLSGKWVHHSKGRKQSQKEIEKKRIRQTGQNNANASGLSDEYFIQKGVEVSGIFDRILSWGNMLILSERDGFKWIKSFKSRFGGKGLKEYYRLVEERTGKKFDNTKRFKL
jgi:hypothetical protein